MRRNHILRHYPHNTEYRKEFIEGFLLINCPAFCESYSVLCSFLIKDKWDVKKAYYQVRMSIGKFKFYLRKCSHLVFDDKGRSRYDYFCSIYCYQNHWNIITTSNNKIWNTEINNLNVHRKSIISSSNYFI